MDNQRTNKTLRSRLHRNTYDDICSSLAYGESVVKLTGIKNTGKSVLARRVCQRMEELNHRVILIVNHPETPAKLQSDILEQIQPEAEGSFRRVFDNYLQALSDSRHFLLILVEDAHRLSEQTLASLHTLLGLRNSSEALIKLLLVGEPELDKVLQKPGCKSLNQRLTRSFNLKPMNRAEVREFANNFLREQCGDSIHFSSSAVKLISQLSKGLPNHVLQLSQQCQPEKLNKALHTTISRKRLIAGVKNLPSDSYLYRRHWWLTLRLPVAISAVTLLLLSLFYLQSKPTEADAPIPSTAIATQTNTAETKNVTKTANLAEFSANTEAASIEEILSADNATEASSKPMQAQHTLRHQIADIRSDSLTTLSDIEARRIQLETEINNMLAIWANAWQRKDLATYFAHYTPEYNPNNATTHDEWLAQRRARISRGKNITISVEPVDIITNKNNQLTIHFMLNYQSDNYTDKTKKEMVLARVNGQWLIEQERNLAIYY